MFQIKVSNSAWSALWFFNVLLAASTSNHCLVLLFFSNQSSFSSIFSQTKTQLRSFLLSSRTCLQYFITLQVTPHSSSTSLITDCSGVSPGSIPPPGRMNALGFPVALVSRTCLVLLSTTMPKTLRL